MRSLDIPLYMEKESSARVAGFGFYGYADMYLIISNDLNFDIMDKLLATSVKRLQVDTYLPVCVFLSVCDRLHACRTGGQCVSVSAIL